MRSKCVHRFIATKTKGNLNVVVKSLNGRGKPKTEKVSSTVFKCSDCGFKKEFPDRWQGNFCL